MSDMAESGDKPPVDSGDEPKAKKKYEPKGPQKPREKVRKPGEPSKASLGRRKFVWLSLSAFIGILSLLVVRFFFPRTLTEPPTKVKVGYPADFNYGVDTRFQAKDRIWMVRNAEGIFAILAKCTHLGCTPAWVEQESKFKCPCHGSGYDTEGINFEGPAPRPLDRCHLSIDPRGQIVVDKIRLYRASAWEANRDSWLLPA